MVDIRRDALWCCLAPSSHCSTQTPANSISTLQVAWGGDSVWIRGNGYMGRPIAVRCNVYIFLWMKLRDCYCSIREAYNSAFMKLACLSTGWNIHVIELTFCLVNVIWNLPEEKQTFCKRTMNVQVRAVTFISESFFNVWSNILLFDALWTCK